MRSIKLEYYYISLHTVYYLWDFFGCLFFSDDLYMCCLGNTVLINIHISNYNICHLPSVSCAVPISPNYPSPNILWTPHKHTSSSSSSSSLIYCLSRWITGYRNSQTFRANITNNILIVKRREGKKETAISTAQQSADPLPTGMWPIFLFVCLLNPKVILYFKKYQNCYLH